MSDVSISIANPWTSALRQPRATIQHIVDTDPEKHVVALAALSGIASAFVNAVDRNLGDHMGLPMLLGIILIVGSIAGVVTLYIWAALVRWTGRWIGGNGTARNLRAAIAWGSLPMIIGGVFMIAALLIAGQELFTELMPRLEQRPWAAITVFLLSVLQLAMGIWSIVAMAKMVGQVQGFSAWRALGNFFLVGLLGLGVLLLVALVAGLLAR